MFHSVKVLTDGRLVETDWWGWETEGEGEEILTHTGRTSSVEFIITRCGDGPQLE